MKTSTLAGAALDWAVAKCEGLVDKNNDLTYDADLCYDIKTLECLRLHFKPSTDWSQGGPIIERERIHVAPQHPSKGGWMAVYEKDDNEYPTSYGFISDTPLIAAMRCYVASQLGDEVEIPEEV